MLLGAALGVVMGAVAVPSAWAADSVTCDTGVSAAAALAGPRAVEAESACTADMADHSIRVQARVVTRQDAGGAGGIDEVAVVVDDRETTSEGGANFSCPPPDERGLVTGAVCPVIEEVS